MVALLEGGAEVVPCGTQTLECGAFFTNGVILIPTMVQNSTQFVIAH
jgi:hypothetical protein